MFACIIAGDWPMGLPRQHETTNKIRNPLQMTHINPSPERMLLVGKAPEVLYRENYLLERNITRSLTNPVHAPFHLERWSSKNSLKGIIEREPKIIVTVH
jgi:hypothetical protein